MRFGWAINTGLSAAAGAAMTAIVGFGWGGWTSVEAASRLSADAADAALAASWTPYCLEQSRADASQKVIAELKAAYSRNRPGVIQNAGWATPIGQTEPSWPIARACALALANQWGDG